jgi:hypothetical protein
MEQLSLTFLITVDRNFKLQHELHLCIYYMNKFLNTSEFIMIFKFFKKIVFKKV